MESAEANACSRQRGRVATGTKIYFQTYLIDILGIAMEYKEINDELSCLPRCPLRQEDSVAIISELEAFIASTCPLTSGDRHITQTNHNHTRNGPKHKSAHTNHAHDALRTSALTYARHPRGIPRRRAPHQLTPTRHAHIKTHASERRARQMPLPQQ